jgi:predicted phosphodiesterase
MSEGGRPTGQRFVHWLGSPVSRPPLRRQWVAFRAWLHRVINGQAWLRHPWTRRAVTSFIFITVTLLGAWLGLLVGGRTQTMVGPLETTVSIDPKVFGHTVVDIAPLGTLEIDSHGGPVGLSISVRAVDTRLARELLSDSGSLRSLGSDIGDDLRRGVLVASARGLLAATLGAAVAGALFYRSMRRTLQVAGVATAVVVGSYGTAWATYDAGAITEPRYTGLLVNAPSLVGDVREIAANVTEYGEQLGRLVQNVADLYSTTLTLPDYEPSNNTIRVLHVSDLHLNPSAWPLIKAVSDQFDVRAIVDTGDIADHGSAPESVYVSGIGTLGVPYVYVRGNHDSAETEAAVRAQPNAVVLDGAPVEVAGLRFLGLPDPRFTPDQTTREGNSSELVFRQTEQLAALARVAQPAIDVVALHDPSEAELLNGTAPLVLAGHAHKRSQWLEGEKTRVMVQGSTGGAGLRALENEEPTPVTLTVLYFDASTRQLAAWDDITLGGLGLTSAQIDRHIASRETGNGVEPGTETPGPGAGLPTSPNGR